LIPEIPFDDDIGFSPGAEEDAELELPLEEPEPELIQEEPIEDLELPLEEPEPEFAQDELLEQSMTEESPFQDSTEDDGFPPEMEETQDEFSIDKVFEDFDLSPDITEKEPENVAFDEAVEDSDLTLETAEEEPETVPFDQVVEDSPVTEPEEPTEVDESNLYMCPSCGAFVSSSASICAQCGYDFEAEENLEPVEEPAFEPFLETEITEGNVGEPEIVDEKPKKKKRKVKLKKKKKLKMKRVKKK
jgi:hypothetical protein